MLSHDQRIATCNKTFRQHVMPALPTGEGAALFVFPVNGQGTMCYISNCERESMRAALAELLDKWDHEAGAKYETK